MTTTDLPAAESGLEYIPGVVNYLALGHPVQSLVYQDYCYASLKPKMMFEVLTQDVIPTCCFTAENLLRFKMDLLICTRICFENKLPNRGGNIEERLINLLRETGAEIEGGFLEGIERCLIDYYQIERELIKDNPDKKIVLGLGNVHTDNFIAVLLELLRACYDACDKPERERFMGKEVILRNVTGEHDPNVTDWRLGWNEPHSDHFYDQNFVTTRPNMKHFLWVVDPKRPLFQLEAAEISLDDVEEELYAYLDRSAEALPTNFYKTFCLTGLANSEVFTVEGFESGPDRQYGIRDNCARLSNYFLKEKNLTEVNGPQVRELMKIVARSIEPRRGPSPEAVREEAPAPAVKKPAPKVYTGEGKIEEFRTEEQVPVRRKPPTAKKADNNYVWIGALLGLGMFFVIRS